MSKDPEIAEAVELINEARKKLNEEDSEGFEPAGDLLRKAREVLDDAAKINLLRARDGEETKIMRDLEQIEEGCRSRGGLPLPGDGPPVWKPSSFSVYLGKIVDELREINKPPQ